MADKSIVLFGAGKIGQYALRIYGDRVVKFCDNNPELYGQYIDGKKIVSLDDLADKVTNYRFIITVRNLKAILAIERQLSLLDAEFEIFDKNIHSFNSTEDAFTHIYREKQWGCVDIAGSSEKFFSGAGSHQQYIIEPYVDLLKKIIDCNDITKITEIGCGDFWIMRQILTGNINYVGMDVVDELIQYNETHFGNDHIHFIFRDASDDDQELPSGELLIIRQVLQHLDNRSIARIMAKTEKFKFVLVTEHIYKGLDVVYNLDKPINNEVRLYKKSGVYIDKPPYNYKNIIHLLEIESDGGLIRTSLLINS